MDFLLAESTASTNPRIFATLTILPTYEIRDRAREWGTRVFVFPEAEAISGSAK
jgi:hypothetical protein